MNFNNIPLELKFLNNVLYGTKKFEYNKFKIISFEKLTEIASSHLMIPALYYNSKIKNILNLYPKDFKYYLSEIFLINRERNTKLLTI